MCAVLIILIYCNLFLTSGVRLKELRKARRITQLKLAMDLNLTQNTVSRYETGEREPGIAELVRIADYFHISVDYLLERTDNPEMNL